MRYRLNCQTAGHGQDLEQLRKRLSTVITSPLRKHLVVFLFLSFQMFLVEGYLLKTHVLSAKNISANYLKLVSHEMVICFLLLLAPMGFRSL